MGVPNTEESGGSQGMRINSKKFELQQQTAPGHLQCNKPWLRRAAGFPLVQKHI
jgi:hypothetical protein